MSIEYCYKHHNYYDTDFVCNCPQCEDEKLEQDEHRNIKKN